MLAKLGLAFTSTALTAGALAVGYQVTTGDSVVAVVSQLLAPTPSPWGFELSFESSGDYGGRCGTCEYLSTHTSWLDGPREGFDRRDPRELARSSLDWLERTLESEDWRDREWLELELAYPSGWRVVSVVHAKGTELSWDKQLPAWFERLPPTAEGGWPDESEQGGLDWTLTFETGSVHGWSESNPEAFKEVRELARSLETAPEFGPATIELAYPSGLVQVELEPASDPNQGLDSVWQRLEAWFGRFPPTRENEPEDEGEQTAFSWTLTFAELGSLDGWAGSASEAFEAMREQATSLRDMPDVGLVTYELGMMERGPDPDAVVWNCYRVETTDASELDELPRKLAEQSQQRVPGFGGAEQ